MAAAHPRCSMMQADGRPCTCDLTKEELREANISTLDCCSGGEGTCGHPFGNHPSIRNSDTYDTASSLGKRNREDEADRGHPLSVIAESQLELEKHKAEQARYAALAITSIDPTRISQNEVLAAMEMRLAIGVEDEINDVDSESWFKKLYYFSNNAVRAGQAPIVVEETDGNALFGPPVESVTMPLQLRAAIRFSASRIAPPNQRASICSPIDEADGNDSVAWLAKQREPKLQWSFLQLLRAAAGNQERMNWQLEDKTQPEPREGLRGFVDARKMSAVEIKKKLSRSLSGNSEGLGQLGRYGARDCEEGDYFAILSSLSYCLFVRITFLSNQEVQSYRVYPPISRIHDQGKLLANHLEHVDPDAKTVQSILPISTPLAFISLMRFIDAICREQNIPITMPVVYLRTPESLAEKEWQLSRPVVLNQTMRSLVFSVDHFDQTSSAGGKQIVVKAAAASLVDREEAIHYHVAGRVVGIRKAIGRVRITGGCMELTGLVLDPLGDTIQKLVVAKVDSFAKAAETVLKSLHAAGVWHRDVKPGNFLTVGDRLLLHDFDLSALSTDASNAGFQSGTNRFASPYLSYSHTYSARDDFMSLIFTVVELVHKNAMDSVGGSSDKKIQLLHDLRDGRKPITADFQQLVATWMQLD